MALGQPGPLTGPGRAGPPGPAFGVEVETAEFAVSNRRHERCFGDRAEARLDHPGAFDRNRRSDHKVVLVVEESRTNEMFWSGTVCGCEYDIRIDQQHDALDAFDHLLLAEIRPQPAYICGFSMPGRSNTNEAQTMLRTRRVRSG